MKRYILTVLLLCGSALAQFPAGEDIYGGITALPCSTTATGFFRTFNLSGYAGFCDPANNFWQLKGLWVVNNNPSGNVDDRGNNFTTIVSARYGGSPAWADATAQRLQSWGFNFTGTSSAAFIRAVATDASYPLDSNGIRSIPHKLPFATDLRPDYYGMRNGFWYLVDPEKNLFDGRSARYQSLGGYLNPNGFGDTEDPKYTTELDGELTSSFGNIWYTIAHSVFYLKYMVGGYISDSDQRWFDGAGNDFATTPTGHSSDHLGWFVATMSPYISASTNATFQAVYQDNVVYAKQAWHDMLVKEYGKIGNLNAAFGGGANYTTFGSSGTTVAGETFTNGGVSPSFSYTTASAPTALTTQVIDNGVVICGDNGAGVMYGPRCSSGTVNNSTGAIAFTWNTATRNFTSIQDTSGTVTLLYGSGINQLGAVNGEQVTIAGTTNYNGTYTILTNGNTPNLGYFLTFALAGTFAKETTGTFAQPAPTQPLTVNYVVNGWCIGTGLMDECGAAGHSGWVGTKTGGSGNGEINGSAGFIADANNAYLVIDGDYFRTNRTTFKAHFPNSLYLGSDTFGTWGSVPRAQVLSAAAPYVDIMETGGQTNLTGPMLNFLHTWFGDKPIVQGQYLPANRQSPLNYPNTTATRAGSVVTATTSRNNVASTATNMDMLSCSDATFNSGIFAPSSTTSATVVFTLAGVGSSASGCDLFFDDINVGGAVSQAARASQLNSNVTALLAATNQVGIHPNAGYMWWRYTDDFSEKLNWGLVTVMDNAYDGNEDVTATGVGCSSPINAYSTCGGEVANFGNLIGTVKTINAGLDTTMATQAASTTMIQNSTANNVTVH